MGRCVVAHRHEGVRKHTALGSSPRRPHQAVVQPPPAVALPGSRLVVPVRVRGHAWVLRAKCVHKAAVLGPQQQPPKALPLCLRRPAAKQGAKTGVHTARQKAHYDHFNLIVRFPLVPTSSQHLTMQANRIVYCKQSYMPGFFDMKRAFFHVYNCNDYQTASFRRGQL